MNTNTKKSLVAAGLSLAMVACTVSTDFDKQVGAENALAVEAQMGTYDKHGMEAYVQQIGARLVEQLEDPEFEFRFKIVDDPIPNAFALPGGYIFVTRGLISLANTEDELACVIAHEIIHVTQRHSVKQMRSGVLPGLVALPGNIVGGVINEDLGNLINAPINVSSSLFAASYSRSHETEADRLGIELAAKAGYEPLTMNSILSRLNRSVEVVTNQETQKSYFDSHPYTPDRVEDITRSAKGLRVASIPRIHEDFEPQINGLLVGNNPGKGVFMENVFLQPAMKFAIDFPQNWHLANQPTSVGAVDKAEDAAVIMGLASNEFSAKEHAMRFQNELKRKHNVVIEIQEQPLPWGETLYSLTLWDEQGDTRNYLTQSWVNLGIDTYQIVTLAPEAKLETVRRSAASFRPMSDEQLASIEQYEIEVVQAQSGDTIDALNESKEGVSSGELLAVMNDVDQSEALEPGDYIKLIVTQPYSKD